MWPEPQYDCFDLVSHHTYNVCSIRFIRCHTAEVVSISRPREQSSWGQHGALPGLVGPRWATCLPHEPCYQEPLESAHHSNMLCINWLCVIKQPNKATIFKTLLSIFNIATLQYIPRNMNTVFALLCFVVVIHWLIFPYPSGLLHWHCGNLTIAPVPAKQSWWIWINTSYEFIMNDCITSTKQSTTKPCAYFLGYTV